MITSETRASGLDIPFFEAQPIAHGEPVRDPESDLGSLESGALIAERYRVLGKLAEGGMGVLYACEDSVLARKVAVKLMRPALASEPMLAERLVREARLAAQLRKHVAQIFDCGMLLTGEPYIVMELLKGCDLYVVLKESGPLAPGVVVDYMLEICEGLAEAHEKGIIHRDLKPENLFRTEEPDGAIVLKILDFGVSKQLSSRRTRIRTTAGESVGSPQYMSPEQLTTPNQVDARTDIWSLGVVMFELLTGNVPFSGAGPAQIGAAVLTQSVPPISNYRSDVPSALEAIVCRCLEREPAARFANVAELAGALVAFRTASDCPEPETEVAPPGLRRSSPVRRWLSGLLALALFGACGAVLFLALQRGRIQLPNAAALERLPARISAWHWPFSMKNLARDAEGPRTAPNAPSPSR